MVARRVSTTAAVAAAGLAWVVVLGNPSHAQSPTTTEATQQETLAATAASGVRQADREVRQKKPSKPRKFQALAGAGKLQLTWKKPSSGGKVKYDERHRLKSKSNWSKVKSTSSRSMTLNGLRKGEYKFKVRARNANGPGEWTKLTARSYAPTLPVVSIVTEDREPITSKEEYLDASVKIKPNGTNVTKFKGDLKIRGRGNSSWSAPKKPYKLKLAEKSELMGMPASKHWALLANYYDRSQLRNSAAMFLGEQTQLAWTPRMHHVEVQLNGEYLGLYQLAETVRIEENRVNIDEMSPTDTSPPAITGGYLLEQDARREENQEFGFKSTLGQDIVVKKPEPDAKDGISEQDLAPQLAYIRDYVNAFEASLPSGYAQYINTRSFIDWYLVQELVRNPDSTFASNYRYKPRSEKLFAGPLWDFDRAVAQRESERDTTGWYLRDKSPWYSRLFTSPAFASDAGKAWAEAAPGFRKVGPHLKKIDAEIKQARKSNTKRWPEMKPEPTDQVDFLTQWLNDRTDWMESQL
jgi:hypothetical protein